MSNLLVPDEFGKHHRLGSETALIYLDETGDENLSDPNYPIFGLGGCCVPAHLYDSNIIRPWLSVKSEFGDEESPLHATDVRRPTKEQLQALNAFFSNCIFSRVASVISDRTAFDGEFDFFHIAVRSLLQRINYVLSYMPFQRIFLILEDSQRTNAQAFDFFSRYNFERNGQKMELTRFSG